MTSTANIFYCEKCITVKKIVQLKINTAINITVRGEGAGRAMASLRLKKLAESDFLWTLSMHLAKKGSNFMLTFSAKLFCNNFLKLKCSPITAYFKHFAMESIKKKLYFLQNLQLHVRGEDTCEFFSNKLISWDKYSKFLSTTVASMHRHQCGSNKSSQRYSSKRNPANNSMQGPCGPCEGFPYSNLTDLAAGAVVAPHGLTARVQSGF